MALRKISTCSLPGRGHKPQKKATRNGGFFHAQPWAQPAAAMRFFFVHLKEPQMAQVPTGTLFSVATTFGSNITVTAVSNASPTVCTATAHGLSDGDVVEITSGWGRLNRRVFEVVSIDANSFSLTNSNTSSTSHFPPGTGTGEMS